MSLQDSLYRFNKQQEKCQSALSSIAKQNTKVAPPTSNVAAPSPPIIKFSNDTERLQHINSIRKSPVGAQMKRVIDLLLKRRQALDADEINRECYVDVRANKAVFESLKNNPKVKFDGRKFSYKSKYQVKSKDQVLDLIRKFQEGIAVIDLKDSYPNVMQDLQALKAEGHIWLLSSFDSKEDIAFPNDPKMSIKVDDDLKKMFREISLPRDMIDIEKDLQKNGMKPSTNAVRRRAMAQVHGVQNKSKTKKKREINIRKITNSHLKHLLFQ